MKSSTRLAEFRGMDRTSLVAKIAEMRESLMKLKFKKASGQLENTAQLQQLRRDIARALSIVEHNQVA